MEIDYLFIHIDNFVDVDMNSSRNIDIYIPPFTNSFHKSVAQLFQIFFAKVHIGGGDWRILTGGRLDGMWCLRLVDVEACIVILDELRLNGILVILVVIQHDETPSWEYSHSQSMITLYSSIIYNHKK